MPASTDNRVYTGPVTIRSADSGRDQMANECLVGSCPCRWPWQFFITVDVPLNRILVTGISRQTGPQNFLSQIPSTTSGLEPYR